MTRLLATAALLIGLAGPEGAQAAPPEARIHGPYCPPVGCPAAPGSALSSGAGFATAAATALLIARRRPSRGPQRT